MSNTSFASAARRWAAETLTENGAYALNTTGDARLDFFGVVGALRNSSETRIATLFAEAYKQDPLFATKIAFYGRDVRGGLGERNTFRILIRYMAFHHPEALRPNLDLIGVYGRYDDLYCLIGTPLEEEMWAAMKTQFEEDRRNLAESNAVSLLAKWIKTADASSPKTRKLGIMTAQKLGYDVYTFKRIVRALRKHIGIVEALMSAKRWDEIKYSAVPSRAMLLYKDAFIRHDGKRFDEFVTKAASGEEKINAGVLYPYDLINKILDPLHWDTLHVYEDETVEALWKQLPNYVEPGTNAIVIADTSGSMDGMPLNSALGLAIYFAERNTGEYHNLWMSFSEHSQMHRLTGETLAQKLSSIDATGWGMNTNLEAAFDKILNIAVKNHVAQEEMPKAIIIISDMEIDDCCTNDWTFYELMEKRFSEAGYQIPNIIFWNVDSRNDVYHVDASRKGVQLLSGHAASTFKNLMHSINKTPVEVMEGIINSDRYSAITVG